MKIAVTIDAAEYMLDLRRNNGTVEYSLSDQSGRASVVRLGPNYFSVLLNSRSFTVRIAHEFESESVYVNGQRYRIRLRDARDRRANHSTETAGPLELRSQMPGKIVKFLVSEGDEVAAGQGVAVIEAMKMQNEMKAPKTGIVKRIAAAEGATVAAGELLLVVA